jgi:Mrp family chromosome partitioning ATPase
MSIVQHGSKDGLYFIPAGARVSNPSELVGSDRLKVLFARMTPAFDWTVIDVPPVLPVSDASTLADLCDGVLLVVNAGHTPMAAAQKACTEFRDRNLVGLVLNHAEEGTSYATDSYYS